MNLNRMLTNHENVSALRGTRMGRPVKSEKEALEECKGSKAQSADPILVEETVETAEPVLEVVQSRITKSPRGDFLFFDVPYQGRVIPCVERPMENLDWGHEKSQSQHLEWLASKSNHWHERTMADMELEYQMLRISFDLRNDSQYGDCAIQYLTGILPLYGAHLCTADSIYYENSTQAVIINKGSVPSQKKRARIPIFSNEKALPLSNIRRPAELDQINTLEESAKDFLKQFLGFGWERAGIVWSYVGARNMSLLPATGLYTYSPLPNEPRCRFSGIISVEPNWIVIGEILPGLDQYKALPVVLRSDEGR